MTAIAPPRLPDATTLAVREFYELFPYPASGAPQLRSGFDARFVLSLGRLDRSAGRPLRILDAGCGRGVGLVTCAGLHPEAQVTGIDLCRPALAEARAELARRGLAGAVVLGFARALGEFGATVVVAGNIPGRTQTLALAIFEDIQLGQDEQALTLVGLSTLLAFGTIWCVEALLRRSGR